ncbi:hypothetical protein C8N38_108145 [Rhodovulum kholense]|uniref:Uncharacterized protein n=1 Tax=Rhodovulum kholense TaxID=453584 RepID=A0A8E3AQ91_9RHOB|nr:hypothetical protein C8N38_108145 [Rhodovulum kholense]
MIRPARTARMAKTGGRAVSVAMAVIVIVIVIVKMVVRGAGGVRVIVHDLAYFR